MATPKYILFLRQLPQKWVMVHEYLSILMWAVICAARFGEKASRARHDVPGCSGATVSHLWHQKDQLFLEEAVSWQMTWDQVINENFNRGSIFNILEKPEVYIKPALAAGVHQVRFWKLEAKRCRATKGLHLEDVRFHCVVIAEMSGTKIWRAMQARPSAAREILLQGKFSEVITV